MYLCEILLNYNFIFLNIFFFLSSIDTKDNMYLYIIYDWHTTTDKSPSHLCPIIYCYWLYIYFILFNYLNIFGPFEHETFCDNRII